MEVITYSLKDVSNIEFYQQLSIFSNKIIIEANQYFSEDISVYKEYLKKITTNKTLSNEEYLLEFIISGTFVNIYSSYAVSSGYFSTFVLSNLCFIRKKFPFTKPVIDFFRGYLSGLLLFSINLKTFQHTAEAYSKLIKWLKATGEFSEEIKRLEILNQFYKSLPAHKAHEIINKSVAFASYFKEQSKLYLGKYTKKVDDFLIKEHKNYKNREDYLFCGRSETEYHLNMFGAELLNRKLRNGFNQTANKTVLLPTCMSNPNNGKCKAILKGLQMKCSSCSTNCEINRLQELLKLKSVETYLIPHSSSFSEFLKHWQNQKTTGLIGVACVLNLLTGGYEMQSLNIPSQCVFLDYCGCRKHWHSKGIPTGLNQNQLEQILGKDNTIPDNISENTELVILDSMTRQN
jgi:uncharacterized protein